MTKLMRPSSLDLFPADTFQSFFDSFFKGLDQNLYNRQTQTLSLRNFPKGGLYIDKNGNRVIELALAGYTRDQLSVTVEKGNLTVSATKCEDECECTCGMGETCKCCDDDKTCCCGPRTLARRAFKQVFSSLGKDFSLTEAEVTYKNGLLRIVVPKNEKEEVTKQLTIK